MSGPPNILLITSDQHHHSCLGAVNPGLRTPALDALGAGGTRFERGYTSNPVCTPARASMITGLYPSMHGAWTIGVRLPEDVPTVGATLEEAGYLTGLVGKAHFQPLRSTPESPSIETAEAMRDLDFWRRFRGPWYGFRHVETTRGHADEHVVGGHYALWLEAQGFTTWRDHFRPWPAPAGGARVAPRRGAWSLPQELHYSRWTAERSVAFIERAHGAGQPFFLWASFHDPHPPYLVPRPWATMYDPAAMEPGALRPGEHDRNPPHFGLTQEDAADWRAWGETGWANHGLHSHRHAREELQRDMAVYYGMVSLMDREIGRLLGRLEELGLASNTLVVFTADHGHFLGQHGLIAKGPFHYEDLIRVPLLVRWPGAVPAGRVSGALQSTVDLAPTFLAAAGLPVPGLMQGRDALPCWRGDDGAGRDHVLVEHRHQPTALHLRTYVDRRHKLTVYRDRPYGELRDLREDPGEHRNLWDEPEAAGLRSALLQAFLNAELRREPTRMARVAGA